MRNRIGRNVKKIAAGLLAGTLILTGVCYLPTNNQKAYAAEVVDEKVIHTERLNMSQYVNGTEKIAPKPKDSGYEEWVFAGWYSETSCDKGEAITSGIPEGNYAYAKFVPAELLSVKCQALLNSDMLERSQLRLVSTVDNLQYKDVGFEIQMKGKKPIEYSTETVYKSITTSDEIQVEFSYAPTDFHPMAQWFTTVTIINIDSNDYKAGILINPFWTTLDGTKVYGVSRYARVEDSYLNIVNVPVRLSSDAQVAAGYLEVKYDTGKCSYVGADNGYDVGTVFEEMEVAEKNGVVRCVGNVKTINQNVKADGMYINLRFKVSDLTSLDDMTFTVSKEQFCDNEEKEIQNFDVFDMVYRNITKKQ